jgi:hypothetical protein
MVNQGALDQMLHLKGAPAHLRRAGVHIEGDELFFDREVNTAKVIGKGMMQSPVRGGLSGEPQAAPSRLDVHWLREMRFDGLVAHYVEGVRTRLDDSVMRCDEMTVTLNRRVDFSADQPETEGLAIQNVLCERGVDFDYVQWIGGQELAGRAEGRAGEFELRYDTGDFQARGGGHLRVWRKDDQRRVDVEPSQSRANEPAAAESLPWQYTYVKFHDRITGNMHKKVATLYDRVSVIHAPVQQVMQVFSRDDLSRDSESSRNAIWLGCDELTLSLHPAPGKDRENIQVLAVGKLARVELEGRLFQANADTLTYDESTNLFTFRGLGNNTVSVAHQERPGAPYNETGGQMIQFNPALRSGSLQGSRGAFGSR